MGRQRQATSSTRSTVTNRSSGLKTAIGDFPITLEQTNATTVTGTYDGGTKTAFTVVIGADGKLTVTQFEPLEHNTDGSTAAAHDDHRSTFPARSPQQ